MWIIYGFQSSIHTKLLHNIKDVLDGTADTGGADPQYKNYIPAAHVEGKAAIYMNENGLTTGTVYYNNTNGTCGFCEKMLQTLLPEDAVLQVVPPVGAVANNPNATDVVKEYIGNSNPIKKP